MKGTLLTFTIHCHSVRLVLPGLIFVRRNTRARRAPRAKPFQGISADADAAKEAVGVIAVRCSEFTGAKHDLGVPLVLETPIYDLLKKIF